MGRRGVSLNLDNVFKYTVCFFKSTPNKRQKLFLSDLPFGPNYSSCLPTVYIVPVLPYVNSITSNRDLVRPNVNHTVPLYILILFPGILVPGISAFDK